MQQTMHNVLRPSKEEALAMWAQQVKANLDQAEKFREAPEKPDFYAPTAHVFKVDPYRTDEAALNVLCELAQPGETWLDIGAGGGRYALPLAMRTAEVIAVEPSDAMRATLKQGMTDCNIKNIRIIEGRWPIENLPQADVAMISHVGYDIEDLGPFLDAMEKSARRLCVAIMLDSASTVSAEYIWPLIHGEKRAPLPALREFLVLQLARGCLCEVRLTTMTMQGGGRSQQTSPVFLRQQLFIEEGGKKDKKLLHYLEQRAAEQAGQSEPPPQPRTVGIVSWTPSY